MMQSFIKPGEEHSAADIISRIGNLTRMLRDSLRELGLDQAIAEAAEAIPDARDRLDYVVQMTAQAAERALNSVEASQPHQDEMEKGAKALSTRWMHGLKTRLSCLTHANWLATRANTSVRYPGTLALPTLNCSKL